MFTTRRAPVLVSALSFLLLMGCEKPVPPEPDLVRDVAERGPLKLTVEAAPKELWIGDELTVRLRFDSPDDYVVDFPDEKTLAEQFAGFEILGIDREEPRPGADRGLVTNQVIRLEALASGVVAVPPVTIRYARKPVDADMEPVFDHELTSEALDVAVLSALTSQDSVAEPRDITSTLAAPLVPKSPWFWAAIAGVSIAGVLGLLLLYRWVYRLTHRPAPPIAPEVWARGALDELASLNWVEREQVRAFYYRLSEIVRVYIEKKFALAAPEMTTEEFLRTLARDRSALPYDSEELGRFLESCDLVKYAAFEPQRDDGDQSLAAARTFIDATAAAAQRAIDESPVASKAGQAA